LAPPMMQCTVLVQKQNLKTQGQPTLPKNETLRAEPSALLKEPSASMKEPSASVKEPSALLKQLQHDEQLPVHWFEDALVWIVKLSTMLAELHEQRRHPLCIGINGAQGSGKTTLSLALDMLLTKTYGLRCQTLSIDDFYLSRQDREKLARQVHPLLQTRGVPGTHNCELAINTIQQLKQGKTCLIPRFNKATDNPLPTSAWSSSTSQPDIILFEGWCVGIPPQDESKLNTPVNSLEQHEDPQKLWRQYVQQQLSGSYQTLFKELDLLIFLQAPGFECVHQWRLEQENKLAERNQHKNNNAIMNEAEIQRFIAHYQRLTEHALQCLPSLADVIIPLDEKHRLTGCHVNRELAKDMLALGKKEGLTS